MQQIRPTTFSTDFTTDTPTDFSTDFPTAFWLTAKPTKVLACCFLSYVLRNFFTPAAVAWL
jgi:hypothetical protein